MRSFICHGMLSALLLLAVAAPLPAQLPPPVIEQPKAPVPAKRDGESSTPLMPYALAAVAVLVVMLLVCMPARRD